MQTDSTTTLLGFGTMTKDVCTKTDQGENRVRERFWGFIVPPHFWRWFFLCAAGVLAPAGVLPYLLHHFQQPESPLHDQPVITPELPLVSQSSLSTGLDEERHD
jgi:hypothetical protein